MLHKIYLAVLIPLCLSFCLFSTTASATEGNPVESTIESITVFRSRAQLLRKAKTRLKQGKNELVFVGLSPKLIENSFQLAANSNQITIFSVQPTTTNKRNPKSWQLSQKLRDSLENARKIDAYYSDLEQVLQNEEKLIIENQKISSQTRPLTPTELAAMAEFVSKRLTQVKKELRDLDQKQEENNQTISRLSAELRQITNQSNPFAVDTPTGEVIVTLEAEKAIEVEFMLQYLVTNAYWNPIYDFRAEEVGKDMQISYRAHVHQTTGIDWKDIKLTLSTADPTQSTQTPEFYAQHLKIYTPPRNVVASGYNLSEVAVMEEEDSGWGGSDDWSDTKEETYVEKKSKSTADYTTVKETALSAEFQIDLPYTILSDGRKQLVEVAKLDVPTTYQYTVFAGQHKEGFLMAKLSNWQQHQLVSGDVNIYFENKFVGKSYLDTQTAEEELKISLGKDSRIVAQKNTLQNRNERKFIGSNITEKKSFEITVKNNLQRSVDIEIIDQIPLSMDSRIEVEAENLSGAIKDEQTGKLTWTLLLDANASKSIKLEYLIKYPKGKTLDTQFVETN